MSGRPSVRRGRGNPHQQRQIKKRPADSGSRPPVEFISLQKGHGWAGLDIAEFIMNLPKFKTPTGTFLKHLNFDRLAFIRQTNDQRRKYQPFHDAFSDNKAMHAVLIRWRKLFFQTVLNSMFKPGSPDSRLTTKQKEQFEKVWESGRTDLESLLEGLRSVSPSKVRDRESLECLQNISTDALAIASDYGHAVSPDVTGFLAEYRDACDAALHRLPPAKKTSSAPVHVPAPPVRPSWKDRADQAVKNMGFNASDLESSSDSSGERRSPVAAPRLVLPFADDQDWVDVKPVAAAAPKPAPEPAPEPAPKPAPTKVPHPPIDSLGQLLDVMDGLDLKPAPAGAAAPTQPSEKLRRARKPGKKAKQPISETRRINRADVSAMLMNPKTTDEEIGGLIGAFHRHGVRVNEPFLRLTFMRLKEHINGLLDYMDLLPKPPTFPRLVENFRLVFAKTALARVIPPSCIDQTVTGAAPVEIEVLIKMVGALNCSDLKHWSNNFLHFLVPMIAELESLLIAYSKLDKRIDTAFAQLNGFRVSLFESMAEKMGVRDGKPPSSLVDHKLFNEPGFMKDLADFYIRYLYLKPEHADQTLKVMCGLFAGYLSDPSSSVMRRKLSREDQKRHLDLYTPLQKALKPEAYPSYSVLSRILIGFPHHLESKQINGCIEEVLSSSEPGLDLLLRLLLKSPYFIEELKKLPRRSTFKAKVKQLFQTPLTGVDEQIEEILSLLCRISAVHQQKAQAAEDSAEKLRREEAQACVDAKMAMRKTSANFSERAQALGVGGISDSGPSAEFVDFEEEASVAVLDRPEPNSMKLTPYQQRALKTSAPNLNPDKCYLSFLPTTDHEEYVDVFRNGPSSIRETDANKKLQILGRLIRSFSLAIRAPKLARCPVEAYLHYQIMSDVLKAHSHTIDPPLTDELLSFEIQFHLTFFHHVQKTFWKNCRAYYFPYLDRASLSLHSAIARLELLRGGPESSVVAVDLAFIRHLQTTLEMHHVEATDALEEGNSFRAVQDLGNGVKTSGMKRLREKQTQHSKAKGHRPKVRQESELFIKAQSVARTLDGVGRPPSDLSVIHNYLKNKARKKLQGLLEENRAALKGESPSVLPDGSGAGFGHAAGPSASTTPFAEPPAPPSEALRDVEVLGKSHP